MIRLGGAEGPKFGGLSSTLAPYLIPDHKAQDLRNVTVRYGSLQKRPGYLRLNRTAGGAPTGVLGIWEFDTKAGTLKHIAKMGASFYNLNISTGALGTAIKTGATNVTRVAEAVTFRDLLLIADYDEFFVYNGTVFGPAYHAVPTTPTAVASGGGDMPNGVYKYITVPYSSIILQEGPPSAAATYTNTTTKDPTVTPTYTADAIWDQVRVYRTTVGGSTYLYHSTVSTPFAAFVDTTDDVSLGSAIASTTRVPITDACGIAQRNDRTFLIRKNDSAVYYSLVGKPNEFEAAGFVDALENNECPVALAKTNIAIYVLRPTSLAMLAGDQASNYSLVTVHSGVGCGARSAVAVYEDMIYFYGNKRIYRWDGMSPPEDISGDIEKLLDTELDITKPQYLSMGVNYEAGEIWFSYYRTGGSRNDRVLRYVVNDKEWFYDDVSVTCMGNYKRVANGHFYFFTGDDLGYLYEHEQSTQYGGIADGTLSGTATGGSTSSLVMATAAFYITEDCLKGIDVEIIHASGARETVRISSNTATTLTLPTLTAAVAAGDTFVVAPIRAWWTSKRFGDGSNNRFMHAELHFKEQTHSEKITFAFLPDNESTWISKTLTMLNVVFNKAWVGRFARRLAFKVEMSGSNKQFEMSEIVVHTEEQEN